MSVKTKVKAEVKGKKQVTNTMLKKAGKSGKK